MSPAVFDSALIGRLISALSLFAGLRANSTISLTLIRSADVPHGSRRVESHTVGVHFGLPLSSRSDAESGCVELLHGVAAVNSVLSICRWPEPPMANAFAVSPAVRPSM